MKGNLNNHSTTQFNNFQIEQKKIFSQDENKIETILGQNFFKELKTKKCQLILELLLPSYTNLEKKINT